MKRIRCPELEGQVIALYQQCKSANRVAEQLPVSSQTVYRILVDNGVSRRPWGVRPKKTKTTHISNCNSDYCPALIMMHHSISGLSNPEISAIVGTSSSNVGRVIKSESGRDDYFHYLYRTCEVCGKEFKTTKENRFICKACLPNDNKSNHRKRARYYGVDYVPGISISALMGRDNNTCQICGGLCDINDNRWGHFGPLHPSIDHTIPMSAGGGHTWENVQLAHMICNLRKGNKAVNSNAEEQSTSD